MAFLSSVWEREYNIIGRESCHCTNALNSINLSSWHLTPCRKEGVNVCCLCGLLPTMAIDFHSLQAWSSKTWVLHAISERGQKEACSYLSFESKGLTLLATLKHSSSSAWPLLLFVSERECGDCGKAMMIGAIMKQLELKSKPRWP